MRKAAVSFALGMAVLVIGVAAVMMEACEGPDRKSGFPSHDDQPAIDFFFTHRPQFERLRELLTDSRLEFVHRDRAELAPADVFAKFPGRKEELLGLMKDLEINFANGTGSDWGIRMVFEATGMAMGGTTKSFSFSDTPPKRIVPSTDHFKPDTADSSSVFRSIAPSWYLRFDWGG